MHESPSLRTHRAWKMGLPLLATALVGMAALATIRLMPSERALSGPHPAPSRPPAEVVAIQLEALAHNGGPGGDAGIDIVYRFAAPENRAFTGPIERFREVVRAPIYRPMFEYGHVEYHATVIDENDAAQLVTLRHEDGRSASFVFHLSRQRSGRFKNCWMTVSVLRIDPDIEASPLSADDAPRISI